MNQLANILYVRKLQLSLIKDLTDAQLNHIPEKFNNNIIWNLAHVAAVLQRITYTRSGLDGPLDESFCDLYKNGTKPTLDLSKEEIDFVKNQLINGVDQLNLDFNAGKFVDYQNWTTSFGIEINSIDAAIAFLPYHEGLHTGALLAIRKLV